MVQFFPNFLTGSGEYATSISAKSSGGEVASVQFGVGGQVVDGSPGAKQGVLGGPVTVEQKPTPKVLNAQAELKRIFAAQGKKVSEQGGLLVVEEGGRKVVVAARTTSGHPEIIASIPESAKYTQGFEGEVSPAVDRQVFPGSQAAQGISESAMRPVSLSGKVVGYRDIRAQQSIPATALAGRQLYYSGLPSQVAAKAAVPVQEKNYFQRFNAEFAKTPNLASNVEAYNRDFNEAIGRLFGGLALSYVKLGKTLAFAPVQVTQELLTGPIVMAGAKLAGAKLGGDGRVLVFKEKLAFSDLQASIPAMVTTSLQFLPLAVSVGVGLYYGAKAAKKFWAIPSAQNLAETMLYLGGTAIALKPYVTSPNFLAKLKEVWNLPEEYGGKAEKYSGIARGENFKAEAPELFGVQSKGKVYIADLKVLEAQARAAAAAGGRVPQTVLSRLPAQRTLGGKLITDYEVALKNFDARLPVQLMSRGNARVVKTAVKGEPGYKPGIDTDFAKQTVLEPRSVQPAQAIFSKWQKAFAEGMKPKVVEPVKVRAGERLEPAEVKVAAAKVQVAPLVSVKSGQGQLGSVSRLDLYSRGTAGKALLSSLERYDPFALSGDRLRVGNQLEVSLKLTALFPELQTPTASVTAVSESERLPRLLRLPEAGQALASRERLGILQEQQVLPAVSARQFTGQLQDLGLRSSLLRSQVLESGMRSEATSKVEQGQIMVPVTELKSVQASELRPARGLPWFRQKLEAWEREGSFLTLLKREGAEQLKVPAYDVFLRRFGAFSKINPRPLSRIEALGLGSRQADVGLAATFEIRKTGWMVPESEERVGLAKFRLRAGSIGGSVERWIEFAGKRLDLFGETSEIQFFRKKHLEVKL